MKNFLIALLAILVLPLTTYAGSNSIYIEGVDNEDDFQLAVKIDNLEEQSVGLAFELYYDETSFEYESYSAGNFFEQGGEPIYLVSESFSEKGSKIVAGITLRRTDTQVSGSGDVIFFNFKILRKNTSDLEFARTVISQIDQNGKRKDLDNVHWQNYQVVLVEEEETIPQMTPEIEEETTIKMLQASLLAIPNLPIAIPISIAAILIFSGVCYILWRKFKKSHATQTPVGPSIEKSSQESSSYGDWAGF